MTINFHSFADEFCCPAAVAGQALSSWDVVKSSDGMVWVLWLACYGYSYGCGHQTNQLLRYGYIIGYRPGYSYGCEITNWWSCYTAWIDISPPTSWIGDKGWSGGPRTYMSCGVLRFGSCLAFGCFWLISFITHNSKWNNVGFRESSGLGSATINPDHGKLRSSSAFGMVRYCSYIPY